MKMLLMILLALPIALSGAEQLKPMSEAVSRIKTKSGDPDLSELAYVGVRCSVLYTAIAAYIEQGTANEKGKELVKTYNEHAVAFFVVGHSLSIRTGKSEENIKKQTMMLLEYYQNEILSGKLLNNDSITALVGSDMKSANEAFPFFEALYADILKEQNADKTKP